VDRRVSSWVVVSPKPAKVEGVRVEEAGAGAGAGAGAAGRRGRRIFYSKAKQ
jgi:hypothetical protein